MSEHTVRLTADEIAFVLNELYTAGHGHGSSLDDFEPECPSCTAADKLAAASAMGSADTVKCNPHPDAPHGFNRDASHSAGRYVCDCEGWEPDTASSPAGAASLGEVPRG